MTAPLPNVCCTICHKPAALVNGDVINGADHKDRPYWFCAGCDAWVGVHPNSNYRPTGLFANLELRIARKKAHNALGIVIEFIQKRDGITPEHARGRAYLWLSNKMMVARKNCHINQFTPALCDQATMFCGQFFHETKTEGASQP